MSDFPTKANPQPCKNGCGAKIYLSNETGKYLPYNLDNSQHDCRDKDRPNNNTVATATKQEQPKNNEAKLGHVVELIHQVLKELEDLKKQ